MPLLVREFRASRVILPVSLGIVSAVYSDKPVLGAMIDALIFIFLFIIKAVIDNPRGIVRY